MALPRSHQAAYTPSEIEFLAGEEEILIIPTHSMPKLQFISGVFGPFRPPLKAKVPLWLALMLKKHHMCSILAPEWLSVDNLKKLLDDEETVAEFSPLPFHYMEISMMLLESAPEDVPNSEQIRRYLKDLRETRQSKARAGLAVLDDRYLGMNNLSLMEINEIRPFFSRAFLEMRKLNHEDSRSSQPPPY
ncbi:DNA replication complex GINS protein PSF2 [Zychaea mexicana]|uniref:DNA replication complex GINS protein PSF2 n=1 Tax=Zychaea mexicana TaxID=64656 RepID=UPI0022FDB385|nr:DNA replication complex GINS protein PSF2 [Zychaea mexicana]KAI9492653.1 DNA replication complex GINS protein PSF2 [Zychaea mexicana]